MFLLFFPPSVTGEYDLRKGEKKKKKKFAVERNHGSNITNPPLLSLSLAYIEILINIENREKQNITP